MFVVNIVIIEICKLIIIQVKVHMLIVLVSEELKSSSMKIEIFNFFDGTNV